MRQLLPHGDTKIKKYIHYTLLPILCNPTISHIARDSARYPELARPSQVKIFPKPKVSHDLHTESGLYRRK